MHTFYVSAGAEVIKPSFINAPAPAWQGTNGMRPVMAVALKRHFSIIDLLDIRNIKEFFSIYRDRLY